MGNYLDQVGLQACRLSAGDGHVSRGWACLQGVSMSAGVGMSAGWACLQGVGMLSTGDCLDH